MVAWCWGAFGAVVAVLFIALFVSTVNPFLVVGASDVTTAYYYLYCSPLLLRLLLTTTTSMSHRKGNTLVS